MPTGVYVRTKPAWNKGLTYEGKPCLASTKKIISEKLMGNKNSLGNKMTPEQIEKSVSKRRGIKFTDEHKENLRISHLGLPSHRKGIKCSKETIENISKGHLGLETWNKGLTGIYSEETLNKMKKSHSGIKQTKESNIKRSKKLKGNIPSPRCGYGKGCYYDSPLQGRIWLRSTYELAYAKYLDSIGILWKHEDQKFDLGKTTYTPDFFLPIEDKYIEIKGYMYPKAQEKINKTLEIYNIILEVLYKEDLLKLGCDL